MYVNKRILILIVGLVIVAALLVGIVLRCKPEEPPVTRELVVSEFELAKIHRACQQRSEKGKDALKEHPEYKDRMYVEGQVIVTGPIRAVDSVRDHLSVELDRMKCIDLGQGGDYQGDDYKFSQQAAVLDEQQCPQTESDTMQLFQIKDDVPAEQVACEVNELRALAEYPVVADPNYHISPAQWAGVASPWTQNGEWVGNPGGGGMGTATLDDFQNQWAFSLSTTGTLTTTGIGVPEAQSAHVSPSSEKERIRVGIFDTSPFGEELREEGECENCFRELMSSDGRFLSEMFPNEMSLTVWHMQPIQSSACPGTALQPERQGLNLEETQDISNHGLFVAGLVHAVAPASDIYLVRVLNDDGCGDLFTINEGIKRFIDTTLEEKGTLKGTVINLSFGLHRPENPCRFGLPAKVKSLESILDEAVRKGAIVVAASGNDSYARPADSPGLPEIPAGYPFVIGVAASNADGGGGCFSNFGDVGAPGGNGVSGKDPCELPDCTEGNHNNCLVSIVRKPDPGYAYWVGTSFAAPLVSGEAVLLLESELSPSEATSKIVSSTTPSTDTLTLLNGIINLPCAVTGSFCP